MVVGATRLDVPSRRAMRRKAGKPRTVPSAHRVNRVARQAAAEQYGTAQHALLQEFADTASAIAGGGRVELILQGSDRSPLVVRSAHAVPEADAGAAGTRLTIPIREPGTGASRIELFLDAAEPLAPPALDALAQLGQDAARAADRSFRRPRRGSQDPMLRVVRAVANESDHSALLQAIADALLRFDSADTCAVYVGGAENETGDRITLAAIAGVSRVAPGGERPVALFEHPSVERAIRRGELRRFRVAATAGDESSSGGSGRTLLIIPLTCGADPVGGIILGSPRSTAFGRAAMRQARAIVEVVSQAVHSARRLAEAARNATAQAVLLAASQAATTTEDTGEALEGIARACLGVAGAERCGIYLWRQESNALEVGAEATDGRWPGVRSAGTLLPLDAWPSLQATLAEPAPRILRIDGSGLGEQERRRYEEDGIRTVMVVPLLVPAGCLGLLALFRRAEPPFSADDLRLGQDLAGQAAMAVHIAHLREEVGHQTREQAILLEVNQAATSSLAGGDVLDRIARVSLGVPGAECCGIEIWRPETDEMEVIAEVAVPEWPGVAVPGSRYSLSQRPAIRDTLAEGHPVAFDGDDPALFQGKHGRLIEKEVGTAVLVPMLAGRECVGLLWLSSRSRNAFAPRGIRLAQELAAQAALAAQNAHLLEGARRRAEEQAALLRVSHVVNSGNDLTSVLPQVARECLGASGVEGATIEVWDSVAEETQVVARAFIPGWPTHEVLGVRFAVDDRPALRSVLETREPLILNGGGDALTESEREALAVDGIQSLLIVPVLFGTDCRGAITLLARRPGAFPLNALWFAQDLAAQVAQAMERARLLAALREQAETDGLTGLLNHRAVMETLDRELTVARRRGGSVAVLLIDLDDFKLFNDTHGHLVGDRVLRDVATLLHACVRDLDAVGRYGGDEFLIVLPDADLTGARRAADRILARAAMRTLPVGDLCLPLRLSVGLATYPHDGDTRQALIAHADAAMYAAKDAGGGKVGTPDRGPASLQETAYGALARLIQADDRRGRYTEGCSEAVAYLANAVGRVLGLSSSDRGALDIAARLHDVGNLAVPDAVLRKPERLASDELAVLRQHVTCGELLVQGVPHAPLVRAAIAAHHECWNGCGYPHGMAVPAIPLLGRILALADAWATMTADRPSRKGVPPARAAIEVRGGAGIQFDPALVPPFLQAMIELGILSEMPPEPVNESSPSPLIVRPDEQSPVRTTTDRLLPATG